MLLNADQIKVKKGGTTRDRETAYRNAINTWLKADPQNMVGCKRIIEQNKLRRANNFDSFGGMKENPKDIRLGLSIPQGLYYMLNNLEKLQGRTFMKDKEDLYWFAKHYPQFMVAERI